MQHLLSIKPGAQFHDFDKHLGSRQGKDFKEYVSKFINILIWRLKQE